ncbi:MAG: excinuclease ABC subunit UvrC [Lachnospiraceae bacterium]|nr:excinuclease ABC subunit UvrC [Lachnospiraceae bacterium]
MSNGFDIREELKKLPNKPGVYIMHDAADNVIYVGKAVNLHNRVRSYFRKIVGRGPQIDKMVSLITRFEYIVTDSELEALVLENNLIKEYSPKYNTLLKDDKTYPYIKVTVGEAFPRLLLSREMKKDKARYFGPFSSAGAVRDTIELLNKVYHLRTCNKVLPRDTGLERPCLNYHIGQCPAPCQGYISQEEYQKQVDGALDFLNGNFRPILRELEQKMQKASEELEFEEAGKYRDLLESVRHVAQKQKMSDSDGEDKDIVAMARDDRDAVVQVFFVRDGRLIGREHYYMNHTEGISSEEILTDFAKQFYAGTPFVPKELVIQNPEEVLLLSGFEERPQEATLDITENTEFAEGSDEIGDFEPIDAIDKDSKMNQKSDSDRTNHEPEVTPADTLESELAILVEWLSAKRGNRVRIRVPRRGSAEKLVQLAAENAGLVLTKDKERIKREEGRTIGAVKEIQEILGLEQLSRMEAYDISNISGFENVGSMVVFEKGKAKKSDYRKFKIKTVTGPNDYECMREVLTRRFQHGLEEREERKAKALEQEYGSFTVFPDLILMDGGRGQVNICLDVLKELQVDIPVCGMVKDDHHRTRGLYFNNVELPIDRHSEGFKLITRIQDEAHRFAIEFHRSLRGKDQVKSVLDDIPGIGPARRKALMRHFDSYEGMRNATKEQFLEIPEIREKEADALVAYFSGRNNQAE